MRTAAVVFPLRLLAAAALSVAFLDEDGKVINIADMTPHSLDSHCAGRPARFALEMNQGWFSGKGIGPGSRIGGVAKAPRPQ